MDRMDRPRLVSVNKLEGRFRHVITIDSDEFTVGRSLENRAVIPHLSISRRHCHFKRTKEGWTVRDVSSGGVAVNGEPLPKDVDAPVRDGDALRLENGGEFVYTFRHIPSPPSPPSDENIPTNVTAPKKEYLLERLTNENAQLKEKLEKLEKLAQPQHASDDSTPVAKISNSSTELEKSKSPMYSQTAEMMESELQCTICSDIFYKAVILNCGHTYCEFCIEEWMKKKKECPVCRTKVIQKNRNLALDPIIDITVAKLDEESRNRRKDLIKNRDEISCTRKNIKLRKPRQTEIALESITDLYANRRATLRSRRSTRNR